MKMRMVRIKIQRQTKNYIAPEKIANGKNNVIHVYVSCTKKCSSIRINLSINAQRLGY